MSSVNSIFNYFKSFVPGARLVDGGELALLTQLLFGTKSDYTALAGGGATGSVLNSAINTLATVVTAADSVALPPAIPGLQVLVDNEGAQSATVFANTANPNNAGAADQIITNASRALVASLAVASGGATWFICTKPGTWKAFVSA